MPRFVAVLFSVFVELLDKRRKNLPRLIDDAEHNNPMKEPTMTELELYGYLPAVAEMQELTHTASPMRIHIIVARHITVNAAAQESESLPVNFNEAGAVFSDAEDGQETETAYGACSFLGETLCSVGRFVVVA